MGIWRVKGMRENTDKGRRKEGFKSFNVKGQGTAGTDD
jgi:hypothetical protein